MDQGIHDSVTKLTIDKKEGAVKAPFSYCYLVALRT